MTSIPWTLKDFVRESNRIEGIYSHLDTEIEAHERLLSLEIIEVSALEEFVETIAPGMILRRKVGHDVRVGNHIAPPGGHKIEEKLMHILSCMGPVGVYQTHLDYETLHPFTDGNGRSGRALWLWQMGGIECAPIGFLHEFYYQTLEALQLTH